MCWTGRLWAERNDSRVFTKKQDNSMRDIGNFEDLKSVWERFPGGAMPGDVVSIGPGCDKYWWDGRSHEWRPWNGMTPPPCPPPPHPGPHPVPRPVPAVVEHFGELRVHGDVLVGGRLVCKDVKQPCVGLFDDYETLVRRWPHPIPGMWAIVGDTVPGPVYRCDVEGYWVSTGETGGGPTLDIDAVEQRVEALCDNYEKGLREMERTLGNEVEAREAADKTLRLLVDGLKESNTSITNILKGQGDEVSAWSHPFINLGNVTSQSEVNAKLNEVYHARDIRYNGPMRISRNGALMLVAQHVIKSTGDSWSWAQVVSGMVQPSVDGTALDTSQTYNVCVRWTDYLGQGTGWKKYGGGEGEVSLKTINGQSLKGEGNIEISAEGSITIDDVVSETSANAVNSRAVARAIAELATSIPDLDGVTADVAALTGRVAATEDLAAELDGRVALVEQAAQSARECVGTFAGSVSSATVRNGSYSGSDGEVIFVESTGMASAPSMFAKRVMVGTAFVYYSNWPRNSAYKDLEKGMGPREDALYIDTTTDKLYLWDSDTKALKEIRGEGGSVTPADQQLDPNSKAAVSNQAVTRAINVINNEIATIRTEGLPSKVQADEQTISAKNADGTTAAVHLADLALQERDAATQQLVTVREVGTVHHTSQSAPATVKGNTAYKLYKTLTSGNGYKTSADAATGTVSMTPVVQMAAGSKLVPAGGVPGKTDNGQGTQLSVEGGELSWVHSSDIGMIQDGALPSGMTRAQVGAHNAEVLRMVAASRWNLILDGMYYVDVQIAASASRETLVANAVTLRRPLRIKGGGLTAARYLFCVEAGGGIVMEDVVLDNLESYAMIYVDPWGGLIESVELYRCTLKTSAAPKSGAPYAYVGRFVRGAGKNVGHVDWVNEYTPNGISRFFNETNGVKFLGLPSSVDVTEGGKTVKKSCWGLKSATASTPTQHYCYNGVPFPGSKNAVWADAWCCYDQGAQLYAPYAAGEYVFRQRADSTTKHKGMAGDFVPQSETGGTDTLYTENGTVVLFTPVYMHDDLVDGVLVRGANPDVEHNGIRKFIVDGCSIMSHSEVFIFGGLAVEEEFRISNNLFYEMVRQAMNLGTGNDDESSDYWNAMSCPLEVCGNTFRGVGYVVETDQPYACALLYEGNTVLFHDNVLENLITTTNTYDCYLSCGKLEYRNNIIRNVLKWKNPDHSLYGYMKAKGTRDDFVYVNKYKDRMTSHPKKFSRLYEGNLFEENLKDVRQICESYLQKYRSELLPDYDGVAWDEVPQEAKDDVLKENVLRTMFDNVVSLWSFDTFTVRNNVFDMPDCMLNGSATSGGSSKLRRFLFNGNVMKFRGFCSSPNGGYNKYLFTIDPTAEGAEAEIIGNSFESKGGEIINTLCVLGTGGVSELFKSFRVEDNKFVNCGYRIAGPSHSGVINAESLSISGNKEAAGLDEGYEIHASEIDDYSRNIYALTYWQYESGYNVLGKESSKFKIQGVPVMYSGPGVFEFWDSQKQGVAANAPKYILLPTDKSRVVIKSTHLCRPAPCFLNSAADTNPSARYSTHIRTVANSSLLTITDIEDCPVNEEVTLECGSVSSGVKIVKSEDGHFAGLTADWTPAVGDRIVLKKTMTWAWKTVEGVKTKVYSWSFAEVSRSTASEHASAVDLPDFFANKSLVFGYDKKDVKGYCVTVRYRLKGMWKEKKVEFRCNSYATNYRSASARGADGCRFGNYQTATSVKYFEIGGMEDLGLHFALRHFSLGSVATTNASFICLNVFTDAEGTRNDPGTDMTIEVCDITGNADAVKSGSFDYGDTSLFETFLPKGSTLTSAERTALLAGDVSAFNMMPQSDAVTRQATLTAGDAGWWCVDPDSGHVVVWTGTAWSE